MRCCVAFDGWTVFCGWAMAPAWRSTTWNADLTETLTEPLQAWIPSNHVWSNFESPKSPQFWNQEPPGAQQLCLPDFFVTPHIEQSSLLLNVDELVFAGVSVAECGRQWLMPLPIGRYIATLKQTGKRTVSGGRRSYCICACGVREFSRCWRYMSEYRAWSATGWLDPVHHTHNIKIVKLTSTTYFCKPVCLRSMCAHIVCRQHRHSSWTKHHHEHSSCVYRFSRHFRTWHMRKWPVSTSIWQAE